MAATPAPTRDRPQAAAAPPRAGVTRGAGPRSASTTSSSTPRPAPPSPASREEAGAPWAARADAITLALASHPGLVQRFRLARTTLRARVHAAEAWFQDLAAGVHRAREVSLICPPEWRHRVLADPLLASPTLESLALSECLFSDAGAAVAAASRLTELSHSSTHISEAVLQSLLSGCPALRSVMLRHIQDPAW